MALLDRWLRVSQAAQDGDWHRLPRDCSPCPHLASELGGEAMPPHSISSLLSRWLTALAGNTQPRVQWTRDRRGHSFYRVYDPQTQRTHHFETAQAVRIWLEGRYGR